MKQYNEGEDDSVIEFMQEDGSTSKSYMHLKLIAPHMFDKRSVFHLYNNSQEQPLEKQPVTSYLHQEQKFKLIGQESMNIENLYTMVKLCENGTMGKSQARTSAYLRLIPCERKPHLSFYLQRCKESLLEYIPSLSTNACKTAKLEYEGSGGVLLCPFEPGGVELPISRFILGAKNYSREANVELQSSFFMELKLRDSNKRHHLKNIKDLKWYGNIVIGIGFSPNAQFMVSACGEDVVWVFKLVDPSSSCFKLVDPSSSCFKLVDPSSSCFKLVDPSSSCFKFMKIKLSAGGHLTVDELAAEASSIIVTGYALYSSSLSHDQDFIDFSSTILICDYQSCYVEGSNHLIGAIYKQINGMPGSKASSDQDLPSTREDFFQQAQSIKAWSLEKVMKD